MGVYNLELVNILGSDGKFAIYQLGGGALQNFHIMIGGESNDSPHFRGAKVID